MYKKINNKDMKKTSLTMNTIQNKNDMTVHQIYTLYTLGFVMNETAPFEKYDHLEHFNLNLNLYLRSKGLLSYDEIHFDDDGGIHGSEIEGLHKHSINMIDRVPPEELNLETNALVTSLISSNARITFREITLLIGKAISPLVEEDTINDETID